MPHQSISKLNRFFSLAEVDQEIVKKVNCMWAKSSIDSIKNKEEKEKSHKKHGPCVEQANNKNVCGEKESKKVSFMIPPFQLVIWFNDLVI